jgi:hypothetical protein
MLDHHTAVTAIAFKCLFVINYELFDYSDVCIRNHHAGKISPIMKSCIYGEKLQISRSHVCQLIFISVQFYSILKKCSH